MRRWSLVASMLAVGLLLAVGVTRSAKAQDATPTVDLSPNADECTIEPRSLADLQAMVGTPPAAGSGEATDVALAATPVTAELPSGVPADTATVEAVTKAIRRNFACYNAGNGLAGLAGLTDEYVIKLIGLAVFDEDTVGILSASPVPLSEDKQTVLYDVRDVLVYPDGRVGALVDYYGPTSPPDSATGLETDLFIFKEVDGVWLLDDAIQNLEGEYGPVVNPRATATP
jgi:hypothetical protein